METRNQAKIKEEKRQEKVLISTELLTMSSPLPKPEHSLEYQLLGGTWQASELWATEERYRKKLRLHFEQVGGKGMTAGKDVPGYFNYDEKCAKTSTCIQKHLKNREWLVKLKKMVKTGNEEDFNVVAAQEEEGIVTKFVKDGGFKKRLKFDIVGLKMGRRKENASPVDKEDNSNAVKEDDEDIDVISIFADGDPDDL